VPLSDSVVDRHAGSCPAARHTGVVFPLVLLGLITHSSNAGSGDEPHYLAIAHSIAFDFDFDVSNNYGTGEPLIAGGGLVPGAGAGASTEQRDPSLNESYHAS
jgi:hypothetical protein